MCTNYTPHSCVRYPNTFLLMLALSLIENALIHSLLISSLNRNPIVCLFEINFSIRQTKVCCFFYSLPSNSSKLYYHMIREEFGLQHWQSIQQSAVRKLVDIIILCILSIEMSSRMSECTVWSASGHPAVCSTVILLYIFCRTFSPSSALIRMACVCIK